MQSILFATDTKEVMLLCPEEYTQSRYDEFKRTGKAPEETFGEWEWDGVIKGKKMYTDALYETDTEKVCRQCKKPRKTFISEGIKNGTLTLL